MRFLVGIGIGLILAAALAWIGYALMIVCSMPHGGC